MTLYDAYRRYQKARIQIENDFRAKMKEAGRPSAELAMQLSKDFSENQDMTFFINYTASHPLTVHDVLKFLSAKNNQKWSCRARLTKEIPEHIKADLESASDFNDPNFTDVCNEILNGMKDETFFEIIFHTTYVDKTTQTETSFAMPITISTPSSYDRLRKNPDLLENMNFYSFIFDGVFKNSDAVWTVCPHREANNFVPNVVTDYMKTVKVGENTFEKERD